ncbi:hypothetical protein T02_10273 [Trichinella nativa]|nr:hypothetical protein T02_10273 [Trichinella nativa]
MIVTKVPYHRNVAVVRLTYVPSGNVFLIYYNFHYVIKCDYFIIIHMNNGEKRILNAVYMEQKAAVTKHNNRMQESTLKEHEHQQ